MQILKKVASAIKAWWKRPIVRFVPLLAAAVVMTIWLRDGGEERRAHEAGRSQFVTEVESNPSLWFAQEKTISDLMADLEAGNVTHLGLSSNHAFVNSKGRYYVRVGLSMTDVDRLMRLAPTRPQVFAVADQEPASSAKEKIRAVTKVIRPIDIVIIGVMVFVLRKSMGKRFSPVTVKPNVRFSDVIGVEEAKGALTEIVGYLRNPSSFAALGAIAPKGVILTGPPGAGKTLLAKAIAAEADANFIAVSGTDFAEKWVGASSENVRRLFQSAREHAPCVVFIDELDSIGSRTNGGGAVEMENNRTINELLIALDGFEKNSGVIVVGATNYLDRVDPALVRDGRFDRICKLTLPGRVEREALFSLYLAPVTKVGHIDHSALAKLSPGLSPAAIANVVNKAAMRVAHVNGSAVGHDDLIWALEEQQLGSVSPGLQAAMTSAEIYRVVVHESGHAIATHILGRGKVLKVSIMPRSGALGVTFADKPDPTLQTRSELEKELVILLAGRAAEEILCGEPSTGAANDLERASDIALQMVTRFGLSKIGLFSHQCLSKVQAEPATSAVEAAAEILQKAMEDATSILADRRQELEKLCAELIELETIDGSVLDEIMAGCERSM